MQHIKSQYYNISSHLRHKQKLTTHAVYVNNLRQRQIHRQTNTSTHHQRLLLACCSVNSDLAWLKQPAWCLMFYFCLFVSFYSFQMHIDTNTHTHIHLFDHCFYLTSRPSCWGYFHHKQLQDTGGPLRWKCLSIGKTGISKSIFTGTVVTFTRNILYTDTDSAAFCKLDATVGPNQYYPTSIGGVFEYSLCLSTAS